MGMTDGKKPPQRKPDKSHWVNLVLTAAFVGFLCYQLGYRQGSLGHQDFTIRTQQAASQKLLEQGGNQAGSAQEVPSAGQPDTLIDLNHADAEELQQLPGIGPERAEAIIRYREENGFFLSTEEVMDVPGIGEGIYEDIRDLITLDYHD